GPVGLYKGPVIPVAEVLVERSHRRVVTLRGDFPCQGLSIGRAFRSSRIDVRHVIREKVVTAVVAEPKLVSLHAPRLPGARSRRQGLCGDRTSPAHLGSSAWWAGACRLLRQPFGEGLPP